MDNTEISTVATVISTFITLIATFGKPVYHKIKDTGWFSITDLSKIEELAEQPQNEKLQGRVEGMLETRIGNEEGFEDKLKELEEMLRKQFSSSDAEINTKRVSKDSKVKSEIEIAANSKGDSKILTEDVSENSEVTSTIKRN